MSWFKIKNASNASQPVEIQIYQQIGKDWWDDSGVDAKGFADQLKGIPKGRKIHVRINSPGGNVWDGLTIYNLLKERREDVTCYIDGVAASIASIIALSGSKVVMPKNAMMMIHDPSGFCAGTAEEMRKMAECLDRHKDSLVSIYVEETGQKEADVRDRMSAETWFTGQGAFDFGLCTDLSEEVKIAASTHDFSRFRNVPDSLRDRPQNNHNTDPTITMKRNILLDPQAGESNGGGGSASPTNKADESKSPTPKTNQTSNPEAVSSEALDEIQKFRAQIEKERKSKIERTIDNHIVEGRIVNDMRSFWINAAMHDETVLEKVASLPIVDGLATPAGAPVVQITSESLPDIGKHMTKLRAPQDAFRKGDIAITPKEVSASAKAAADFHWKNRDSMMRILNANTIGTDLKRNVLLQEMVRAFGLKLLPLRAFSTLFGGVRLEGTDKVAVSYFPLEGTASTDFNPSNGYVMGDSTQNAKAITIDKRKYQPIRFDSSELARQPALNLTQIGVMKAEKLAVDVFNNILSVVTNANYGAAAFTGAAGTFDAADVVDLMGVADAASWPTTARALIIKSAYAVNLLKANVISASQLSWQNYGSVSPIQDGVVSRLAGFDIYTTEQIPANAENLVGLMAYPSGILAATSYVNPADEVRQQLSKYEVAVHPTLGIGFEYRCWGSPDFDQRREVIECNYGFAVGEAAAVERLVSA